MITLELLELCLLLGHGLLEEALDLPLLLRLVIPDILDPARPLLAFALARDPDPMLVDPGDGHPHPIDRLLAGPRHARRINAPLVLFCRSQ